MYKYSSVVRFAFVIKENVAEMKFIFQNAISDKEQVFLSEMFKKRGRKYSENIRCFALTLYFYSPKAYSYVRKKFGKQFLPHPSTMRKWYEVVDGSPGFSKEALDAIATRASEKSIVVNLVMDEMSIRSQLIYDKNAGNYFGGVDIGNNTLRNGKRKPQNDNQPLATNALVCMAVSLNDYWKVPIGYFLIRGLDSQERADLLTLALHTLHNHNCHVFSITFDGAASNISMCEVLGANFKYGPTFKPYFENPATKENVYVFWDMVHMAKLIRNTLGEWGALKNGKGEQICWEYLKKLHELQKQEGLKAANKLTAKHINFSNNKMSVKLALQVFSRSVYNSFLLLLQLDDPCIKKDFDGCLPTTEFFLTMNNIVDILNCKNRFSSGEYDCPLTDETFTKLQYHAQQFEEYLATMTDKHGLNILMSLRKTGFLGMIVCLRNIFPLFLKLKEHNLSYLLTYKLSQDYLETLFSILRGRGGWNNNPNVLQFKSAYKKIMVRHELKEFANGNCLFDNVAILHVSSAKIKCPVGDYNSLQTTISFDHDYVKTCFELSHFAEEIVQYIAGYVAYKLIRDSVTCSFCKDQLLGEKMPLLSELKNRGPYVAPSESVKKICKISERILRESPVSTPNIKKTLLNKIAYHIADFFNSPEMHKHVLFQNVLDNHRSQLCKFVAERYINIRLFAEAKKSVDKDVYLRAKYNKLILFSNQ